MEATLGSGVLNLRPELSLIASLAHESASSLAGSRFLNAEYYQPAAVATSIPIGRGGTYTILRKRVTIAPAPEHRPSSIDGFSVTPTQNAQATAREIPPPSHIVYKVAEVDFTDEGHALPAYRPQLAGVLIEFLILLHGPVQQHPFLPRLFGFAWGHNSFSPYQRIPIPIVSYADLGSLATYQQSHLLDPGRKRRICWEIAVALKFLHACGICHGDIKTENVLLYRTHSGGIQTKLADFALSVISDRGGFNFSPPGTVLWSSPEKRWQGSARIALDQADTYSYGLLAWRVCLDGHDPLSRLILTCAVTFNGTQGIVNELAALKRYLQRPADADLRFLMENDYILQRARPQAWTVAGFITKCLSIMNTGQTNAREAGLLLLNLARQIISNNPSLQYGWLNQVVEQTLKRKPRERYLQRAIDAIALDQGYTVPNVSPQALFESDERLLGQMKAAASNEHPISWLAMRTLEPSVCHSVFQQRLARARMDLASPTNLSGLHLGNAACMIGGMGSDKHFNVDAALESIAKAARAGNLEAMAIVFRMYDAFEKNLPRDIDHLPGLQNAAPLGSVAAYEDLKIVGGELANQVRFSLTHQTCGVGADIFFDYNCLNGWKFSNRKELGWIGSLLASTPLLQRPLILVNKRGDNFLHAAAALNHTDLVQNLISTHGFPLDTQNDRGETPLLCAMRSGAYDIVMQLLDWGANPLIGSKTGDTPFHWVISLTEFGCKPMIDKLLAKGAKSTLDSWAEMCMYAAIRIPSFHQYSERLSIGTPLHWAVCRKKAYLIRHLMHVGARVDFYGPSANLYTCMEQAAYLHEASLLRLMVEKKAPKPRKQAVYVNNRAAIYREDESVPNATTLNGFREIYRAAIDGSDRYSLLIRHGSRYRSQMRRTFTLLGEEMESAKFPTGIDKNDKGQTPLYYAAAGGYGEALDCILKYAGGREDLNTPCGHEKWTPICEAIRRSNISMFETLRKNGATLDVAIESPALSGRRDWGLLHVVAQSFLDNDLTITTALIDNEIRVDGYGASDDPAQSPLSLAIENDSFVLADKLRRAGADINALSRYILGGRAVLSSQATILGQVIASNMRHSHHKLDYLLSASRENGQLPQADFVVVPQMGYTALHWTLLDDEQFEEPIERDVATMNIITEKMMDQFDNAEQINHQDSCKRHTALHIAARKSNKWAVGKLVKDYGADTTVRDCNGKTALELAHAEYARIPSAAVATDRRGKRLKWIIALLTEQDAAER